MKTNKALGTEKISKLIRMFSVPCIFSLLISALYNIIDQIFIGNSSVGYLGNAATSIVFPITIISYAFAWCFGDGAVALMSIHQGQKDDKSVSKIIGNSITAIVVASIIYILLCSIFMDPLLRAFGASDASLPLAKAYFSIILFASTAPMLTGALTSIIRADGKPAYSMVVNATGAIINIILDPIFIFSFGWGIEGAAIATVIAQLISFILGIYYIIFKSRTFKLKLSSLKLDLKIFWQFTKLGLSTFITQMSTVAMALVMNMMLVKYGTESIYGPDIPIATMGITTKVASIVTNIIIGLVVGAQPIFGYNYGAGNYDRVKKTLNIIIKTTIVVGIISTAIFQLFPDIIISIFGVGNELYMEFARKLFHIFLIFIGLNFLTKVIAISFQAVGEPKKATILALIRDFLCLIPLFFILPLFYGIDGILYAAPVADIVSITLASILAIRFYRNLGENQAPQKGALSKIIAESKPGVIITIAREHGSAGKEIGRLVAKELGIPFYYKEMLAVAARKSGLSEKYLSEMNNRNEKSAMRELYLGSAPAEYAIKAQRDAILEIAKHGSCVIIGRAADYVLKDNKKVFRVFISAPEEYKIEKLHEMYGDDRKAAIKAIKKSNRNRASYYNTVSGLEWGKRENYDLSIDSSIGNEATAKIIVEYAKML